MKALGQSAEEDTLGRGGLRLRVRAGSGEKGSRNAARAGKARRLDKRGNRVMRGCNADALDNLSVSENLRTSSAKII